MADQIAILADVVARKIDSLGFRPPTLPVIRTVLKTMYLVSMRTEEGRLVRGSVTFADPAAPDLDPPLRRRASYPSFTAFEYPKALAVNSLVKLFRAVERWCGSIAVCGTRTSNIVAWGVVDQLVHDNVRLIHESEDGFTAPGLFTVAIDGIGELSVRHGDLFLAGVVGDKVIRHEQDALTSEIVNRRLVPFLRPIATRIAGTLHTKDESTLILALLLRTWRDVLARLCIGLRRNGSGGAFLLSPRPRLDLLDVGTPFRYGRLGTSAALWVLDRCYVMNLSNDISAHENSIDLVDSLFEERLATVDAEDREDELTGAVRLVASMGAVDGLVLMTPTLSVLGFGVKIRSGTAEGKVFRGPEFASDLRRTTMVDTSGFGTRHCSMLRYCRADPSAIGIVVSQDGQVRLVASWRRRVLLWDNIKLLGHQKDVGEYARQLRERREYREEHKSETRLGYTDTPKTMELLMGGLRNAKRHRRTRR